MAMIWRDDSRRIECPRCHTVTDMVEQLEIVQDRADLAPCYRCRICGHIFAFRDLTPSVDIC
jgi:rubredoxin